ncbi:MAG: hypothetical protein D3923_08345 [Candidatus Electrothrix sp. AR3]|nr:hypothetical protein [Candidatus Electrothrix sp. AR3]
MRYLIFSKSFQLVNSTLLFDTTQVLGNLLQNEVKMMLRTGGLHKPLANRLIFMLEKGVESE